MEVREIGGRLGERGNGSRREGRRGGGGGGGGQKGVRGRGVKEG